MSPMASGKASGDILHVEVMDESREPLMRKAPTLMVPRTVGTKKVKWQTMVRT
jgi:hypothetical protein